MILKIVSPFYEEFIFFGRHYEISYTITGYPLNDMYS